MISEVILADKIQEIANKKNISINQLAHMINYSPKSLKHTLYKMKKNNQDQSLSFDCFIAITEALNINIEELM
ncbi:Cro/C1-type helix-turn-helix DNA-binding protein [Hypnocyclicus thermotrophus]|uniref:Cro/C1-type helix-turn-helix DNA-binding protein n=1 Tax=Hypnocyclicus thermotrophus TaxID=1627895 RepID=A0AA46DXW3_9FUSO|nr:helix-turn-helix transcriptional regulator [Hypnocyclicus thermotrophus]TDT69103.1 Cro/C1-type helix-turn-helix DNA-binding protein [Hypnocyclicus thermotrophus]